MMGFAYTSYYHLVDPSMIQNGVLSIIWCIEPMTQIACIPSDIYKNR
jgi:hypothetical protein